MKYLFIAVILVACSKKSTPQKTNVEQSVIIRHDTIVEQVPQYAEIESQYFDTIKELVPCPAVICPPAKVKRLKVKNSYNYIGEINELKKSNQIKDSHIDSLNMQIGRKCAGTQTNNGAKWYLWFFIGMACGGLSYQLSRTLITKKL